MNKTHSVSVSLPNGKTAQPSVIHFGSCNYTNTERFHIDKLFSLLYCKLYTVLHVSAFRCIGTTIRHFIHSKNAYLIYKNLCMTHGN
jgi:hypothetical protein